MNTAIHIIEQLKWNLQILKIMHKLTIVKKLVIKILNFRLVIMLKYQNIETFLLKDILQIGLKKFLWLKKIKIQFHGHMLLMILMAKKLYEKKCKKQINKNLEQNKWLRKQMINYMLNGKDMIIHLIFGLIKKMLYKNESIFS